MITLQVKHPLQLPVDKSILLKAAETTLQRYGDDRKLDITIVIGDDSLLKKLNKQYRGLDASTDVLAFPSGEIDLDTAAIYLGDVIISLPKALEQAASRGHPLTDELQLLVVHGVLHLMGYDHTHAPDKIKMQAAQDKILIALGVHLQIHL